MELTDAFILGVVEGLTEFLPISSTAHLLLTERLLNVPADAFSSFFVIGIQLGAIAAVLNVYWRTLLEDFTIWKKIAAAFVPTALIGLALHSYVKAYLFASLPVIAWALFLGGFVLLAAESLLKHRKKAGEESTDVSYRQAMMIGLFQSLAIVPGVSRAAATVIGGMSLGISRRAIIQFSFLLAVPTMLAATALDLLKSELSFSASQWGLFAVGFITAWLVAVGAIKFLLHFIEQHTFAVFGFYRIALGLALLLFFV
ncbi:MAG TPA: undecaprenyl-diphosphatase UppP [Candidatus Paceibacterota bacterium]|nr:undecaprenyl-diphosphatase UppP [Candidatus Paceibacterota bacterium]